MELAIAWRSRSARLESSLKFRGREGVVAGGTSELGTSETKRLQIQKKKATRRPGAVWFRAIDPSSHRPSRPRMQPLERFKNTAHTVAEALDVDPVSDQDDFFDGALRSVRIYQPMGLIQL